MLGALTIAVSASARDLILCKAVGQQDVAMSLRDRQFRGRMLNCMSGAFIADMTPCAPPGAYGLSAPTGSAALVAVVDRWQAYADHLGGVAGHYVTADTMGFSGGSNGPSKGYQEQWSFTASRMTGQAELREADKPPVAFICARTRQRF